MALSHDGAAALDAADPLAGFRDEFLRHADPIAYLDGNSLGRPPRSTVERLARFYDAEWGGRLIRGWDDGWVGLPEKAGDEVAAATLGAGPGQVVVADSTSVNLFKVLHAACGLRSGRHEVVVDDTNFPTDRYLVEAVADQRGLTVRWLRPDPVAGVRADDLAMVLGAETAVVVLSHVDYRSGALADLPGLTRQIHEAGAVAVWDLCHSAGVVPVGLDANAVDFAVGCTYKYLNAGPGAPAFLYVARRHLAEVRQPIPGWWSAADMFAMAATYESAPTIAKMLSGTANVPGIIAVQEGVRLIASAGIDAIRTKSMRLTEVATELADEWLAPKAVLVSPRDPATRGGHITVQADGAAALTKELTARGVIPDFRNPDMIRIGLSPLTTSYAELWTAMATLRGLLNT